MTDHRLQDDHVIVTGAAQGIGRGIATRAARAGAAVSILDTDDDAATETAARVRETGSDAAVLETDVADREAVEDAVAAAVDELGPVDGLVNNAGVQRSIPVLETDPADLEFHYEVNTNGVVYCSQAVARRLIDAGRGGAIVNVASTAAERPFPGQGPYAASKAAAVALTTVMAKEWGDHDITVNAINPGTVDTPMVQQWLEENAARTGRTEEAVLGDALDLHTLDRMGQPEEIGDVAVLLLSAEGEWITGEAINVDGGYTSE
jgi:3-oxoacyl-[acyl-carrier protein] reductase/meso-butanediol dehydrogenase/(S,S)-butanediol dehydrogenase/diacetyl reductase